jgi:hypothetical protein
MFVQSFFISTLLLFSCTKKQYAQPNQIKPVETPPAVVLPDFIYPAEVLDLTNWKLNTPTDTQTPAKVDEYKQPALNTFTDAKWFYLNAAKDGVVFKANVGGVTTSGSGYP